jgi:hypothetical protein
MIVAFVLILISLSVLAFLFSVARGRSAKVSTLDDLRGHTRPVDLESFRNLIDPSEEEFLRTNLSPRNFRVVQRERLRAAVEYVQWASQNAAVLLRLGEAARASADPGIAEAAQLLIASALRLRLYALLTIPKLYIGIALPGTHFSPGHLADRYQKLSSQAGQLVVMQNPTRTPRLSVVL